MAIAVPHLKPIVAPPRWAKDELWRKAQLVPSLDQPFASTKSLVDAISGQQLITFSRTSDATVTDSTGTLITVPSGTPRFDHNPVTGESLGLLVEEQRTNSIRNNTMVGAVAGTPGTLPTNWTYAVGSGGISRDIVGTGTENGISYIDIRFYGTTTNASPISIGIDGGTAATGQTWTASLYWKLVGGSLTGITGTTIGLIENTSGGAFVTGAFYAASNPSSSALSLQRVNATRTLSGGATVGVCALVLNFSVTNSTAIDFTLRIGLPQLEQGAFATSVIPTAGTAVTRAADVASITGSAFSGWYRQDEGTVFCDAKEYPFASSAVRTFYGFENSSLVNTDWHRQWIWNGNTAALLHSIYTSSGGPIAADFQAPLVNEQKRAALAYRVNDFARSYNGATPATDTSGNLPVGINRLGIGSNNNTSQLNGHIRRFTYWRQRLGNEVLQRITQ